MKDAKIWLLVGLVALVGIACTTNLHHGLDEGQANQMIVVLERHGIEASKELDPRDAEKWVVSVPSGVRVDAWEVLSSRGLPRPDVTGFDAFYPRESLVPTADEERILLQYATAQELRETLLTIDSVVDAQVNLVLPEKPRVRLSTDTITPPRASVLVKYRARDDEEPPVSEADVKALIAGGVDGLDQERVTVLLTRLDLGMQPVGEIQIASVGPVSVAAASKTALQVLVGGLVLLMFALAGALVFVIVRQGRSRG